MITGRNVRQLMAECQKRGESFKDEFRKLLGVKTKENENGEFPHKLQESEAQVSPDEFSIRELAQEFLGSEFVGGLGNKKTSNKQLSILREAANPVTASSFSDINAFNATVGGLIERQILAGYQLPEFIADQLFDTMPTRVNGGRLIGLPNVTLPDGPTVEGQEYPSLGLDKRWAIAPENVKYADKLALTRESVIYDLSGELLARAQSLGMSLAYVKEYWCAGVAQGRDIVAGTPGFMAGRTCNTFIYKGLQTDTPNATYQTAAGSGASAKYNAVNSFTNPMATYTDFQDVQAKLNLMREYETGYPILAPLEDVLVSPNVEYNARTIIFASQVVPVAPGYATSGTPVQTFAANPIKNVRLISSPIWNKQLVDSGLSQSNSDVYWYAGSFKRQFVWREVWPMSVVQANPSSETLLERDIVNSWFASWFGVPMVRDNHYVIQSTN